jgi:50S ribosomal protein L16 3-hydroxylase
MGILNQLIAPFSLQEFSEQYLFQVPYAAPSKALQFQELIYWPLLWEIFSSGHNDCWLVRQGLLPSEPSLTTGRLSFEQAKLGFEDNKTIVIRHAERAHSKLAAIAEDFHQIFQDPVDIQLYATPPGEEGFSWHYDVEEVFVIQSVGEKEFFLRKNTINPFPLYSQLPKDMRFEQEKAESEIRCLLKAGDWLYIPAGWWHKARAHSPSFHMSIGVMALTGAALLRSLLPELEKDELWRKRLPIRGAKNLMPEREKTLACREALKALSQNLNEILLDETKLKNFVQKSSESVIRQK